MIEIQVALIMAEAQLAAANVAAFKAYRLHRQGRGTLVEAGRTRAARTRLEAKVHRLRYELSCGAPA